MKNKNIYGIWVSVLAVIFVVVFGVWKLSGHAVRGATELHWYSEQNGTGSVALYPDYDPGKGAPHCKVEISTLSVGPTGSESLSDWVTGNLHADPTVEISEISRRGFLVASDTALEWRGILNGATTTLVYISQSDEKILEIAPSTLAEGSGADNDTCDSALRTVIANIESGIYKP